MHAIDNHCDPAPQTIRQHALKHSTCLFLAHLQMEPLPDLPHRLVRLEPDIRHVGVHHERKQVKDEVAAFAKGGVSGEAIGFEGLVIGGGKAAHAVDHFFAEFEWGREGFGVAAEDVAEVDVEEVAYSTVRMGSSLRRIGLRGV